MQKNSTPLHYQLSGSQNPQFPWLLLLHGFLGQKEDWNVIITQLPKTWTCLSIDLPGHGLCRPLDDPHYPYPEVVKFLSQVVQTIVPPKAPLHVLGYSMGGRLALGLASHLPHRFKSLILESAHPGLKNQSQRNQRIEADEAIAQKMKVQNFAHFLKTWYSNPMFGKNFEDHKTVLIKSRLSTSPHFAAKALRGYGLGTQPYFLPFLQTTKLPILYIAGKEDLKFSKIAQDLAPQNQAMQVTCIPVSGHNVHLQNPSLFSRHIIQFLAQI